MATFFFDYEDGSYITEDQDGHECEDVQSARLQAMRALHEICIYDPKLEKIRKLSCSVRDINGVLIHRVSLILESNYLDRS